MADDLQNAIVVIGGTIGTASTQSLLMNDFKMVHKRILSLLFSCILPQDAGGCKYKEELTNDGVCGTIEKIDD